MERREFLFGAASVAGLMVTAKTAEGGKPSDDSKPFEGVGVFRHPEGAFALPDGTVKTGRELAEALSPRIKSGSILCLPTTTDEYGNFLWDFRIEGGPLDQVKVERKP